MLIARRAVRYADAAAFSNDRVTADSLTGSANLMYRLAAGCYGVTMGLCGGSLLWPLIA